MGLERFLPAHDGGVYNQALLEIKCGKKQSHWMWFIFPQRKGLRHSSTAKYYGIAGLEEARQYLQHPMLGKRLVEISKALFELADKSALNIFGSPYDMKLRPSMTLFSIVERSFVFSRQYWTNILEGILIKKQLTGLIFKFPTLPY